MMITMMMKEKIYQEEIETKRAMSLKEKVTEKI